MFCPAYASSNNGRYDDTWSQICDSYFYGYTLFWWLWALNNNGQIFKLHVLLTVTRNVPLRICKTP